MKMKSLYLLILPILLIILGGCEETSSEKYYTTVEEALSVNLSNMSAKEAFRTDWEDDRILIVFYQENAMGLGSVVKSEKGYQWIEQFPFFNAEYAIGHLLENEDIVVIVGMTGDKDVKQVKIKGDDQEVIVDVYNGYYLAVDFPEKQFISIEPI